MSEETRRADKSEFEATRAQEKTTQLQAEAEVHFQSFNNNNNNRHFYSAVYLDNFISRRIYYYPGFSLAAVYSAPAFQGINSCQVPIYITWVGCGKCRSMSCQWTLVPRQDSNRGPCDRQSGDVSTRPRHL